MRSRRVLLITFLAVLVLVIPVYAGGPSPTGDRINLVFGPSTFPADTAFYIEHGWSRVPGKGVGDVLGGLAEFQLELDGAPVPYDYISRQKLGNGSGFFSVTWVFNFPNGLYGTHTFTGHWMMRCKTAFDIGVFSGSCNDPNAVIQVTTFERTVDFLP